MIGATGTAQGYSGVFFDKISLTGSTGPTIGAAISTGAYGAFSSASPGSWVAMAHVVGEIGRVTSILSLHPPSGRRDGGGSEGSHQETGLSDEIRLSPPGGTTKMDRCIRPSSRASMPI